jgi:hypothetical protein
MLIASVTSWHVVPSLKGWSAIRDCGAEHQGEHPFAENVSYSCNPHGAVSAQMMPDTPLLI